MKIADEMTKYGYLGPYEGNILERISLIEVYELVELFIIYFLHVIVEIRFHIDCFPADTWLPL